MPAPAGRHSAISPKRGRASVDVRKSQAKVQSMKLYAKADVPDDGGGRVKLDVSIAVKRPAQLRLTAESTLTGPLLTLATDGQRFQLLDAQNNRYLSSVVTPCSMARLLRVALPPTILADVLSGGVPLLPPDSLTVQSDWDEKEGGREVIKLRDPEGRRQVLYLQPSEPEQAQSRFSMWSKASFRIATASRFCASATRSLRPSKPTRCRKTRCACPSSPPSRI
ncbi:MAG: DUF4292 domain-containing protein [Polyangia bacterium]